MNSRKNKIEGEWVLFYMDSTGNQRQKHVHLISPSINHKERRKQSKKSSNKEISVDCVLL